MSRAQTVTRMLVALVVGSASGACGGGGSFGDNSSTPTSPGGTPGTPQANTVVATNNITFEPGTLTVARGATVTFTFQNVGHNVFFDASSGAPSNIADVLSNTSVTRTFSVAGSFGFECHVHPGMRGTVVVQ